LQNGAPRPEHIYPPEPEIWPFLADCPNWGLIEEISDKWTVLVIAALSRGRTRFNHLKHALDPVTQKSLTQAPRRLGRSGMASQAVLDTCPAAVDYAISPLVRTLVGPFLDLYRCVVAYQHQVEGGARRFDTQRGTTRGS
jgi:DNA-binding HxlR family transcriptional regulator